MTRNGTEILSDIDRKAQKKRKYIEKLNDKIAQTQSDLEKLHEEESQTYRALAELRHDLIDDSSITLKLSKAEKTAHTALSARKITRKKNHDARNKNQQDQITLEDERAVLLEKTERFAKTLEEAENAVLKALEDTEAYRAMIKKHDDKNAQIDRISHKIIAAENDYEQKAQPYKNDLLFTYLWDCGYGTSAYKSGKITRIIDQWVARICDYDDARPNYAMLSSIPKKLAQHQEHLEEKIMELDLVIAQKEQQALQESDAAILRQRYEEKRKNITDLDRKLETLENDYADLLKQTHDDTNIQCANALNALKNIYKGKTLRTLRRDAAMTATRDDDALIQTLYNIDDKKEDMKNKLSAYRKSLKKETHDLKEIQNVRTTFKSKRYDNARTTFNDPSMFKILLGQFVTGILTNTHFWSAVGRLCVEIIDEVTDIDIDMPRSRSYSRSKYRHKHTSYRRHSSSRRRKKSSGGFRTGGRF